MQNRLVLTDNHSPVRASDSIRSLVLTRLSAILPTFLALVLSGCIYGTFSNENSSGTTTDGGLSDKQAISEAGDLGDGELSDGKSQPKQAAAPRNAYPLLTVLAAIRFALSDRVPQLVRADLTMNQRGSRCPKTSRLTGIAKSGSAMGMAGKKVLRTMMTNRYRVRNARLVCVDGSPELKPKGTPCADDGFP